MNSKEQLCKKDYVVECKLVQVGKQDCKDILIMERDSSDYNIESDYLLLTNGCIRKEHPGSNPPQKIIIGESEYLILNKDKDSDVRLWYES